MKKNKLLVNGSITMYYMMSLMFAALYLFGHINQLQNTIIRSNGPYLNVNNILLCILGVVEALLPVLLIIGNKKYLKWDLYAISVLYMLGNLWFIKWLAVIVLKGNVSFDFAVYQLRWFDMFNHTTWASRNAETLFLNYINCIAWYNIARYIDKDKYKTCINLIVVLVNTFILPIIFFAITRHRIITTWWLQKSVTLFFEFLFILLLMFKSSLKRGFWSKYICAMDNSEKK